MKQKYGLHRLKPFFFKNLTHQEVVDFFNENKPITLKYNLDLVDRVHAKYPLVSKKEIGIVIRASFQSFRDLLFLGKMLFFRDLFYNVLLKTFRTARVKSAGVKVFTHIIKVALTTPKDIKLSSDSDNEKDNEHSDS